MRPVSTDGGPGAAAHPLWSPDTNEIYYRRGDSTFAVSIETTPELRPGEPVLLFSGMATSSGFGRSFSLSSDGELFLMPKQYAFRINIVLNWFEELKRIVPAVGSR